MSQAMMFNSRMSFRALLQSLDSQCNIQDADGEPESAAALLGRLDGDDAEDVRAIPELEVAGINRDGGLVFIRARKQETKGMPVWINLAVPPPDRFRIVPYDPTALSEQLAEHINVP